MRKKILAVVLACVGFLSVSGIAHGDITAQGQCKKHTYDCNGNSECAPPHVATFPNGQQKKC